LLAQRSQETIEIIEELDALERNCATNDYSFDSRQRKEKERNRAVLFFLIWLAGSGTDPPDPEAARAAAGQTSLVDCE
jgi:hypothetical protein